MKTLTSFLLFSFTLFFIKCNTTEPPSPDNRKLTLTFEDASCTEAWIKLTAENLQLPAAINILINDSLSHISILTTQDSLLYIDSLLPNKTYNIQASSSGIGNQESGILSNELSLTTMDTTSHNFTWQSWTFGGDAGGSVLSDVAIINDTSIWAVGAIYLKDSLGNFDPNAYNAVHWDGTDWKLFRIQFYTFCGQSQTGSYPASSILIFNNSEIWISSINSQIALLNNEIQTGIMCLPVSVKKMWGISRNNIYTVGSLGQIGHYNGQTWQKFNSGTDLDIRDIWGDGNEIIAVASNDVNKKLLRIQGNSVTALSDNGLANIISALWFISNRKYYVVGAGVHFKHSLQDVQWTQYPFGAVTTAESQGVKGDSINNVFVAGSFLDIAHYNGYSWKNFRNYFSSNLAATGRIAVKNGLVVTVGLDGQSALLIMGKQN
jgi:hypothetical protein